MTTTILHAELSVEGIDARFLLNDLPLPALRHRRSTYVAIPVHEYLVAGTNTLEIVRTDKENPGESNAPMRASFSVTGYALGAQPGTDAGRPVARLDWDATSVGTPRSSFELPDWPHQWAWQHLPVIDWLAPQAVQGVEQFLQEFAARFHRGDVAWIAAALEPKMRDYCEAYGMSLGTEVEELKGRMARRVADPAFKMTPFTAADLALRPCAQGRLVDCVLQSGEPAIRWSDSRVGTAGAMVIRLGLIGQQLRVIR